MFNASKDPKTTVKTAPKDKPATRVVPTKKKGLTRPCNLNTKDLEHLLLCDLN